MADYTYVCMYNQLAMGGWLAGFCLLRGYRRGGSSSPISLLTPTTYVSIYVAPSKDSISNKGEAEGYPRCQSIRLGAGKTEKESSRATPPTPCCRSPPLLSEETSVGVFFCLLVAARGCAWIEVGVWSRSWSLEPCTYCGMLVSAFSLPLLS